MKITGTYVDPYSLKTGAKRMYTKTDNIKNPSLAWTEDNKFGDLYISGMTEDGNWLLIPLACVDKIGDLTIKRLED